MEYTSHRGERVPLWRDIPFPSFVEAVAEIPEEESNLHWMAQSRMLLRPNGSLIPDFTGHFENLSGDFFAVSKKIGLEDYDMPHLLKSGKGGAYHDAYDENTLHLATKRYAEDLSLLDYQT